MFTCILYENQTPQICGITPRKIINFTISSIIEAVDESFFLNRSGIDIHDLVGKCFRIEDQSNTDTYIKDSRYS